MFNHKKQRRFAIIGGLALIVVLYFVSKGLAEPGKYDTLAQCIAEKKAVFYGAFWCPHCQSQKDLFGTAKKYLPYVECSTPDGRAQKQECVDKKVEGYPTWEFANGSRLNGEISLKDLAAKTGCQLPE